MDSTLDNLNVLRSRDSEDTLSSTATQYQQTQVPLELANPGHDGSQITNIVLAGMGGSGLAGQLAKTWLDKDLSVPLELVRSYQLPDYVGPSSLVVVSSCSGTTEEVLAIFDDARRRGVKMAIITGGGTLAELASSHEVPHVMLPTDLKIQPRMLTIVQLRALVMIFNHFGLAKEHLLDEIAKTADFLKVSAEAWAADIPTDQNYAKQLALQAVGKTPVFYGGELTRSVAYKWKISWNENAKNVAFWNEYPEVNHNEFMGWTSHPVEKPFAVFDLVSNFENERVLKRFEVSDRLLSGKRPKAITVHLEGETLLEQLLWANILADYASIYVGLMNNVDPGPVPLITKLKQELIS